MDKGSQVYNSHFYLKKDGLELGQGFIVDFEKVRNLLPGGEIKG